MDLFSALNFRDYTIKQLKSRGKNGYGQLKKLAEHLGVHTTFVSQVFKGEKTLSPEQGIGVAEFLGLTDLETRYFIKLIQLDRAGTVKLRQLIQSEADALKEQSQRISNRLAVTKVLPDEQKAIFYSAWYYSAVRLLIGIEGFQDSQEIARHLGLTLKTVSTVISFLLETGLLVRDDGVLKVGPSKTHLDPESPFIRLHHMNWRNQALLKLDPSNKQNLHYSSPMTLGHKEAEKIKGVIVKMIEDVGKIVDPAPNEKLMCINVDWFGVTE